MQTSTTTWFKLTDKHQPPIAVRAVTYGMAGAIKQCIEKYLGLAKKDVRKSTEVLTPCIDDPNTTQSK